MTWYQSHKGFVLWSIIHSRLEDICSSHLVFDILGPYQQLTVTSSDTRSGEAHLRSSRHLQESHLLWSTICSGNLEDFFRIFGSSEVGCLIDFVISQFCGLVFIKWALCHGFATNLDETWSFWKGKRDPSLLKELTSDHIILWGPLAYPFHKNRVVWPVFLV